MACIDEIANCSHIPYLFATENGTCRWPTAELCLRTCGECERVRAAHACTSLREECTGEFCHERVDWSRFFQRVVDTQQNGASVLNRERPWVAEFPNFLSDEEADEIRRIGAGEGFRDEDDLPHTTRNVSVTNCDSARCIRQPFINELYARMSRLLQLPARNFESMEFLHYSPGQHYVWHRDEFGWNTKRPDPATVLAGPRILTVFFYLSTVDEGGETAFLGGPHDSKIVDSRFAGKKIQPAVLVKPVKGKAIMWANMQADWQESEPSSSHTALPVRKGIKWAATLWVHAAGFRVPEIHAGPTCSVRPAMA